MFSRHKLPVWSPFKFASVSSCHSPIILWYLLTLAWEILGSPSTTPFPDLELATSLRSLLLQGRPEDLWVRESQICLSLRKCRIPNLKVSSIPNWCCKFQLRELSWLWIQFKIVILQTHFAVSYALYLQDMRFFLDCHTSALVSDYMTFTFKALNFHFLWAPSAV